MQSAKYCESNLEPYASIVFILSSFYIAISPPTCDCQTRDLYDSFGSCHILDHY